MENIHYFAFGANMNKLALKNRGVFPINSKAAVLRGYRLEFREGTGNVVPDPEASTHGVFHILTIKDMEILDVVEGNGIFYKRTALSVELYEKNENGTVNTLDAFVYVGEGSRGTIKKPSERYVNLLITGAEEHGLEKSYIDSLKKVEYIPSKKPEEYSRLPEPVGEYKDKVYTIQEYEQLISSIDPSITKYVILGCNKKLVKITIQSPEFLQYATKNFHGVKDNVLRTVKSLTNSSLPPVNSEQDLTDHHRWFVEDVLISRGNLEVIGYLKME